jgi:hypothetical protein
MIIVFLDEKGTETANRDRHQPEARAIGCQAIPLGPVDPGSSQISLVAVGAVCRL